MSCQSLQTVPLLAPAKELMPLKPHLLEHIVQTATECGHLCFYFTNSSKLLFRRRHAPGERVPIPLHIFLLAQFQPIDHLVAHESTNRNFVDYTRPLFGRKHKG